MFKPTHILMFLIILGVSVVAGFSCRTASGARQVPRGDAKEETTGSADVPIKRTKDLTNKQRKQVIRHQLRSVFIRDVDVKGKVVDEDGRELDGVTIRKTVWGGGKRDYHKTKLSPGMTDKGPVREKHIKDQNLKVIMKPLGDVKPTVFRSFQTLRPHFDPSFSFKDIQPPFEGWELEEHKSPE